jgi:hypothetical protein
MVMSGVILAPVIVVPARFARFRRGILAGQNGPR